METKQIIKLSLFLKGDIQESMDKLKVKFQELEICFQQIATPCAEFKCNIVDSALAIDKMSLALQRLKETHDSVILPANTATGQLLTLYEQVNITTQLTNELFDANSSLLSTLSESIGIVESTYNILDVLSNGRMREIAAMTGQKIAQAATTAATWALATAQKALNAVMRMNPIGLVVTAIAALVGGVIVAYKNFEGFRNVVDKTWEGTKRLAMTIWNSLVKALEAVKTAIAPVWGVLKHLLGIDNEALAQTIDSTASSTDQLGETSKMAIEGVDQFTNALKEQDSYLGTNQMALKDMTQQLGDLHAAESSADLFSANINKPDIKPLEGILKGIDVPAIEIPLKVEEGGFPKVIQEIKNGLDSTQKAVIDIGKHLKDALNNVFGNFGEALGESLATGDLSGTFNAILSSIMDSLKAFGGALIAAGTAGIALQAVSWNPVFAVGAGIALIAAASAAKAALQNAVKPMANGGIAYGTTFAMVGEYPGAANNPEVIAPLNKLKQLIQPAGEAGGTYEFRLRGRDFVAVAAKYNQINNRTR